MCKVGLLSAELSLTLVEGPPAAAGARFGPVTATDRAGTRWRVPRALLREVTISTPGAVTYRAAADGPFEQSSGGT